MKTVTVTIGRNVDGEPMGSATWRRFIDLARDDLTRGNHGVVVFDGDGDGTWEGKFELAHTFVVLFEDLVKGDDYPFGMIRYRLGCLARWAKQDAIAFTVGETQLVEG